jgi:glycosyltransferase involved in cell wall biosynthesis
MPGLIGRMSAGMALIKPVYSKIASAPTKLAEYLGCGIPCLGNAGVGDIREILEGRSVGIALQEFSGNAMQTGASQLVTLARDPNLQQRCRQAAIELFSLDGGVAKYAAVYEQLTERAR